MNTIQMVRDTAQRATRCLCRAYSSSSSNSGAQFLASLQEASSGNKNEPLSSSHYLKILSKKSPKGTNSKSRPALTPLASINEAKRQPKQKRQAPHFRQTSNRSPANTEPQDIFANFNPDSFKYKGSVIERENEFYTEKIKQIYQISHNFEVMVIGESKGPQKTKLKKFLQTLQENEVFDIVSVQEFDGVRYALVRATNKEATLRTFSDKKAQEVTRLYGRTHEKRRDGSTKFIKVSWEISQTDLENQKTNEILSQLKKGYKLTIAIDTKDNLQNIKYAFEPETHQRGGELNSLELLRREKALEYTKDMLQGIATIEMTGSIKGKVIITATPKLNDPNKNEGKKAEKDKKKQDRLLKQKKREEEKRLKMEARKRELDETMAKLE